LGNIEFAPSGKGDASKVANPEGTLYFNVVTYLELAKVAKLLEVNDKVLTQSLVSRTAKAANESISIALKVAEVVFDSN
jgi:hypothetical protein